MSISIRTKHFGFFVGGISYDYRRRWDRWCIRVAFGECGDINRWYKYRAGVDIQLLPNFIWYQDRIGVENGRMVIHTRIVGIQSWPFMRFCGGRP